ncbi:MAG TPA: M1 family aminopeptidase, partial [Flavobacteriaceae bacterium]|nr:M1 family aminopeptidase [Flavobacteriaceae bacterium]
IVKTDIGVDIHFFYKNEEKYRQAWTDVQEYTAKTLTYFHNTIGAYPWKKYAVIQGGDGGMEYAMCTLIEGGKTLNEILGTVLHEVAHAWFQQAVANNENKYSWMDEGSANFISTKAYNLFVKKKTDSISTKFYNGYYYMVKNGLDEPLTTNADRFKTNVGFSMGSYTKGQMFLTQLQYIIGKENLNATLKEYYKIFKLKHAKPMDFINVAEKVSGLQLKWYLNEWIETTHTIDYAIAEYNNNTVKLARLGPMPMPIEVLVTYTDNTSEEFYIPLALMRGEKPTKATVLKDWSWGNPYYSFTLNKPIKSIVLDKSGLMADIDRSNNTYFIEN